MGAFKYKMNLIQATMNYFGYCDLYHGLGNFERLGYEIDCDEALYTISQISQAK